MKRLLTLALSLLMLFTSFSFVGCMGEDTTEADVAGKVQLNVAYANLGYGDEFYKWVCKEFESTYTKYDVQVKANDRTSAQGNGDVGIAGLDDDIAFYGFQQPHDFITSMKEVTDIYSAPAYDDNYNFVGRNAEGATVSLADRMTENELNMVNYNDTAKTMAERKIYGVPLQTGFLGLWYDMDLFEEKGLYARTQPDAVRLGYLGVDGVATIEDTYGPDRVEGTMDDGLPATWEDWKSLLMYMKDRNISQRPFVWSGQHVWMSYRISEQIAMSYEGYNNWLVHSSYDGQLRVADGEYITITPETGYKLWDTDASGNFLYRNGVEAAAEVAQFVADNGLYAVPNVKGSSHLDSQDNFLDSRFAGSGARNAYLYEGVHWQYEARETFAAHAESEGPEYGLDSRAFGYWPIPRFYGSSEIADQTHDMNVISMAGGGPACTALKTADRIDDDTGVNVLEVAKDFLLFLQDNTVLNKMADTWKVIPSVAIKNSDAQTAVTNPMVANMAGWLEEINDPNSKTEASYLSGVSLCRSAGKDGKYYEAVQSASQSMSIFGARLNGGDTIYQFNEFAVRHYKGNAITAADWMKGVADWANAVNVAGKWAAWLRS